MYVADCLANKQILPSSEENGEPLSSLWRMSLCGRLGPVFQAPLFRLDGIVALVARLKSRGRLKPKQIVVAAMRKLLVLCFGVLKTGKPFDPAIAMGC